MLDGNRYTLEKWRNNTDFAVFVVDASEYPRREPIWHHRSTRAFQLIALESPKSGAPVESGRSGGGFARRFDLVCSG